MALILRYRLEPPDSITQEIYAALSEQVGQVGLNVIAFIGDEGKKAEIHMVAQFLSVEGEHASKSQAGPGPGEDA